MLDVLSFAWLHDAVSWLLAPALAALLFACAVALVEAGIATGERFYGLARLGALGDVGHARDPTAGNRSTRPVRWNP